MDSLHGRIYKEVRPLTILDKNQFGQAGVWEGVDLGEV